MIKKEKGQMIFIAAVLLAVAMLFLAVTIESTRLLLEYRELNRAADAAGKTGLILIGDQMVTQVVSAQTSAAKITSSPTPNESTPGPTTTPTPLLDDFLSWLSVDHMKTLVAPSMQTLVATHVLGSAEKNGYGLTNPLVAGVEITYPYGPNPGNGSVQIRVRIDRRVEVIFGKLLNLDEGVISGETKQGIP